LSGKSKNVDHVWGRNRCEKCGKLKEKFYIFIAQGQGVFNMGGRGAIVIGANKDAWREQLLAAFPRASDINFRMIEDNRWEHPPVGLLVQGEKLNYEPYLAAIKKHLTEKNKYSVQETESAVSATISK